MTTDFSKLTTEDMEKMDKRALIAIIKSMQTQLASISKQLELLTEQIVLMNQRAFGRKTEQVKDDGQLSFFNETETLSNDNSKEPEIQEIVVPAHKRKKKSSRKDQLQDLPTRIFEHKLEEDELRKKFPKGYKELPPETYQRISVVPQMFFVDEHRIHKYASKDNDGTIVRAERPADIFRNSIATASIIAAIITEKYLNHQPLERQAKAFLDNGVDLKTNTMANWMIRSSEEYFSTLVNAFKEYMILNAKVIHADETPLQVIHDDRDAGSKSYMWVYRNGACDSKHPIVIYDYQKTRKVDHPMEFLRDYFGVLVTDGYQVYHSLEKKRSGLKVAGCWVHSKRKLMELVKSVGAEAAKGTVADEAVKRISEIVHLDNRLDSLSRKEREEQRQLTVKPKVDDFFVWAKEKVATLPPESATAKALRYSINQEQYLRVFLTDGNVPMDNNRAEQAIRPFTLGRKNWVTINSVKGARASAILYSVVETAKANNLRVFDYLEYVLTEMSKHYKDENKDYLKTLMPWTKLIQKKFKKFQKA